MKLKEFKEAFTNHRWEKIVKVTLYEDIVFDAYILEIRIEGKDANGTKLGMSRAFDCHSIVEATNERVEYIIAGITEALNSVGCI